MLGAEQREDNGRASLPPPETTRPSPFQATAHSSHSLIPTIVSNARSLARAPRSRSRDRRPRKEADARGNAARCGAFSLFDRPFARTFWPATLRPNNASSLARGPSFTPSRVEPDRIAPRSVLPRVSNPRPQEENRQQEQRRERCPYPPSTQGLETKARTSSTHPAAP